MKAAVLADALEAVAHECEHIAVPADPFERDALYGAAMRCDYAVLGLAQRILVAQRELDAEMGDRRPYPKPRPKPTPKPRPPKPRPKPGK